MNSPRLQFQKNKELADRWRAIAHTDWFSEVLIFARAEFLDNAKSKDELIGAKAYENILLNLAEVEDDKPFTAGPRLEHELDSPRTEKPRNEPKTQ